MKKLLIFAVAVLMLTACTKEQQTDNIIGTWEVYYYCINGTEWQPEFVFGFTKQIVRFKAFTATKSQQVTIRLLTAF